MLLLLSAKTIAHAHNDGCVTLLQHCDEALSVSELSAVPTAALLVLRRVSDPLSAPAVSGSSACPPCHPALSSQQDSESVMAPRVGLSCITGPLSQRHDSLALSSLSVRRDRVTF